VPKRRDGTGRAEARPVRPPTRRPLLLWAGLVLVAALALLFTVASAANELRFAVIGDYGDPRKTAGDVAAMIRTWDVDLILTVGDNNYEKGGADTIDANVGQHYNDFIAPYRGTYGPGADRNRFFPAIGDHDWLAPGAQPYLDYFELPGNERYYTFERGVVRFFALNSMEDEPDGSTADSVQAKWLRDQLAASPACWNVVYFHHPPYASGQNGSTPRMRWPFKEWGADVVFAGHDHIYERAQADGFTYFTVGISGRGRYDFKDRLPETVERWNAGYGAMRVSVTPARARFEFVALHGVVIDRVDLTGRCASDWNLPLLGRLTPPRLSR
jgi:tartrate-resistant acid phosphatase type 5